MTKAVGFGILLGVLSACSGGTGPAPDGNGTTDSGGLPTTDGTPGLGDVVIEINGDSVIGAADTRVLGVFTQPPTEVRNLAQCLGGQQFCLRQDLPDVVNASVDVDGFEPKLLETIDTVSAGPTLTLGNWSAPFFFDSTSNLAFYSQIITGTQTSPLPIDLTLTGDVWPATDAPAVIEMPDPIGLRLIDPMFEQDFVDTDGIPLRWAPGDPNGSGQSAGEDGPVQVGAPGEVFLYVETPTRRRIQKLADTGSYDLDLSGAGLTDGDVVDLMLGRWTRTEVQQGGRTTFVTVQRNQRIRGLWRSVGVRTTLFPDATCAEAQTSAGIDDGFYEGRFAPTSAALDPTDTGCTGRAASGRESLVPVDVRPQHELRVRYQLPDADASLYLLTDCNDEATCLVGADGVGPETITWINESPDLVRVYVVMDVVGEATGDFTLDIRRRALGGDVLVNSCVEAIEQGPVGPGFFEGSLLDHANLLPSYPDAGPCGGERQGGEGIVAVELSGGQSLDVSTFGSTGMPGIHILSNCSIAASCVAFGNETLTYTNPSPFTRTVYVVLDAELGIDQYRLDVSF
ncbi:MAG: hypothetical protein AAGA48_06760 [Myxococcota bacterium]